MSEHICFPFVGDLTIATQEARLRDFVDRMEGEKLETWFVKRHSSDGTAMEDIFSAWLHNPESPILRISGDIGAGKSTLGNYFFLGLAQDALLSGKSRIPVMTTSADLQSILRGVGSEFQMSSSISSANADLVGAMGQAVIFVDGYDPWLPEVNSAQLQATGAKIVILQGQASLPDQPVFVRLPHRQANDERIVTACLSNFTLEQMREVIRRYFPVTLSLGTSASSSAEWRDGRLAKLLSGTFDELLTKPAMAHTLCRIAAHEDTELEAGEGRGQWVFRAASRKTDL